MGLKITIDCDDQINDTNYLNNSKYALLKFGSSNETDHSSCNKYDKATKVRLYKFYADPARIPDVKYEYDENEYFIGEINLTQTAHGLLVSLDEYASIAGGVVSSNSITRFGHTLKFFDDSRSFKVINNNFKSRFEFDAKSDVPAIEIEGKMYVDPETLSKALGANLVYYKENVLEIFDPHFHTVCDASVRPTAIGNEKPQYNKVIFVGGPWIDGWNSAEIRGMKLSDNFTMGEFQCGGFNNGVATCQCGHTIIVAKDMIDEWQKVREYFNSSFTVTSGYRCVLHNRGIGASKGSRHQNGDAADMTTMAGYNQIKNRILTGHCDLPNPRDGRVAYKGSFNGVAASSSKNFVHADTRSWASNWNY